MKNRIFFKGNPYPGGHLIKAFSWSARIDPDRGLIFDLHLETDNYYAEDETADEQEELRDWHSKVVWGNYHNCTLSSTFWGGNGIVVGTKDRPFDFDHWQEKVFTADPLPLDVDFEDFCFNIYLLGHDACADHRIAIKQEQDDSFSIHWTGKIALYYAGEAEFKHDFEAHISPVSFDGIHYPKEWSQEKAMQALSTLVVNPGKFAFQDLNPKSFKREYKLVYTS